MNVNNINCEEFDVEFLFKVFCEMKRVRKSAVSSFILEKVDEMKVLSSTMAGKEKLDSEVAPWRVSVHGLDKEYYG